MSSPAVSVPLVGVDLAHHEEGNISIVPVASVCKNGIDVLVLHHAFPQLKVQALLQLTIPRHSGVIV